MFRSQLEEEVLLATDLEAAGPTFAWELFHPRRPAWNEPTLADTFAGGRGPEKLGTAGASYDQRPDRSGLGPNQKPPSAFSSRVQVVCTRHAWMERSLGQEAKRLYDKRPKGLDLTPQARGRPTGREKSWCFHCHPADNPKAGQGRAASAQCHGRERTVIAISAPVVEGP